jgi:hypothetical protein
MTDEEVTFIRVNGRIRQLVERPDVAGEVAQLRADMAEADRTYARGLAALRQAAPAARGRSRQGRRGSGPNTWAA